MIYPSVTSLSLIASQYAICALLQPIRRVQAHLVASDVRAVSSQAAPARPHQPRRVTIAEREVESGCQRLSGSHLSGTGDRIVRSARRIARLGLAWRTPLTHALHTIVAYASVGEWCEAFTCVPVV
ncbi:hypothetical protein OH76DRAFT_723068 [Lentinus brumalis]|uniref:Uncharacterized protein n=1 Tax=Lentinus brumalis TaxID=2498619 RepID=A0A371D504_9APHY|nr:hypothetical protein OH76DRAFT_723068 [Polyporus brumalis]